MLVLVQVSPDVVLFGLVAQQLQANPPGTEYLVG
jgi:hypothetical protein